MPELVRMTVTPACAPSVSQLLSRVEGDGVAVLRLSEESCSAPLPTTLMLAPRFPATEGSSAGAVWFGASLVQVRSGAASAAPCEERGLTLVLAPSCLRLFPFILPALPPRLRALVLDSGRFASLSGGGYGAQDVGTATVGDGTAAGGSGVAFLAGHPPEALLEAISGTFPLFQAPAGSAAPSVLSHGGCSKEDRDALMRKHWSQLQPFLPTHIATWLTGGNIDTILSSCLWCVVRYPAGDPFPHSAEDGAEDASAAAGRTVLVRDGSNPSLRVPVLLPPRPYYVLPDFLLMRYISPCLGTRSMEPRLRPQASAAAVEVKQLLDAHCKTTPNCFYEVVIDDHAPVQSDLSKLLQAASTLSK